MNPSAPDFFTELPWWKKCLLSAVSFAVLGTVVWCNVPDAAQQFVFRQADENLSPMAAYRIRLAEWSVAWAAHVGGLDNKWQMYGGQSRFNWRYIITAHYGEGSQTVDLVLPIPRQSERTWFQRTIADFKEAKFLLNIYNDSIARESYARYLARQFPIYDGRPVTTVSYTMGATYILPPLVAVQEQQLLEPETQYEVINVFDVRSESARMTAVSQDKF